MRFNPEKLSGLSKKDRESMGFKVNPEDEDRVINVEQAQGMAYAEKPFQDRIVESPDKNGAILKMKFDVPTGKINTELVGDRDNLDHYAEQEAELLQRLSDEASKKAVEEFRRHHTVLKNLGRKLGFGGEKQDLSLQESSKDQEALKQIQSRGIQTEQEKLDDVELTVHYWNLIRDALKEPRKLMDVTSSIRKLDSRDRAVVGEGLQNLESLYDQGLELKKSNDGNPTVPPERHSVWEEFRRQIDDLEKGNK